MSESRLRELLADLVSDVDSPPMAEQAWRAGRRSRQRRIVAGAAVAAVLMVGAGTAVADLGLVDPPAPPGPGVTAGTPPAPSPPAPAQPLVHAGPEPAAVADLPQLSTRYAALSHLPTSVAPLSAHRVSRIVAAVQLVSGRVLVLGQDGAWREADPALGVTPDQDGSRSLWLVSTSVSPDARRLALVRVDGVLLIDATTGEHNLLPVPHAFGRIDNLLWLPDADRVAVSGDRGSGVLSTEDGGFRGTEEPVHDLAVSRPGEPVVRLTTSELVLQQAGTTVRRPYGTGDQGKLDQWYGAGWVDGSKVASTGFLNNGELQATAVVDLATARITHLLVLPFGPAARKRSNGCCAALGWLDRQTVLLRDGGHVLAWRLTSGTVYRVARLPETTGRGADPGHEPVIALAME